MTSIRFYWLCARNYGCRSRFAGCLHSPASGCGEDQRSQTDRGYDLIDPSASRSCWKSGAGNDGAISDEALLELFERYSG